MAFDRNNQIDQKVYESDGSNNLLVTSFEL
jgi:hypothetical protein